MGRNKNKKAVEAGTAAAAASCVEEGEDEEDAEEEDYVPLDGSWVAELEEAQGELSNIMGSPGGIPKRRGEALAAYLRLCRAYRMLRQWDKLEVTARKGLKVCAYYASSSSSSAVGAGGSENVAAAAAGSSAISAWERQFRSYRERSSRERSVPSDVDDPHAQRMFLSIMTRDMNPAKVSRAHGLFLNSNVLQHAVLVGDMPLMEAMVARGTAIEFPFADAVDAEDDSSIIPPVMAPADATALVVACANLALAEFDHPALRRARRTMPHLRKKGQLDRSTGCAMQLVRLGADPSRTFNVNKAEDTRLKHLYLQVGFDGKSALELAQMTRRNELVELMERHLHYSQEERARVVHCRCGSRLPWTSCHATGIGQPPHSRDFPAAGFGFAYRLSPHARCPCKNTTRAHYDCCWKDTARPVYLLDQTGEHMWTEHLPQRSYLAQLAHEACDLEGVAAEFSVSEMDARADELLRSSNFGALFAAEGPKSRWSNVGSGRVRRLREEARRRLLPLEGSSLAHRQVRAAQASADVEQGVGHVLR
jgi:hypothetical protein